MSELNAFIGQFVTDLGAAFHAGMVVIGEKLVLYKALAGEALNSANLPPKLSAAGFSRFRRATETPFNIVYEARP